MIIPNHIVAIHLDVSIAVPITHLQSSSSSRPNPCDVAPKCALCISEHPSNYRCCSIYKDLQYRNKLKSSNFLSDKLSPKKFNVQVSHPVITPTLHPSVTSKTYAQATLDSPPPTFLSSPLSPMSIMH